MIFDDESSDDKARDPNPDTTPPEQPDGLAEGERLKAEAHEHQRQHRQQIMRDGSNVLRRKIQTDGYATIDDVRAAVPCPPGIDPRCFGAIPGPMAKCGEIKPIGITKSKRSIAHARMLIIWGPGDMNVAMFNPDDTNPPTAGEGVPL